MLGVHVRTVGNWEQGAWYPEIRHWGPIIAFLGYDPHPEPQNLAEHLLAIRRTRGWTYHAFGSALGVSPDTIASWEQGLHRPKNPARRKLCAFLKREGLSVPLP